MRQSPTEHGGIITATLDTFYKDKLSESGRCAYDKIYAGLMRGETSFSCAVLGLDISMLLNALEYDNPELFFVDFSDVSYNAFGIYFNSLLPVAERKTVCARADEIFASLPVCRDTYDAELAVHGFITTRVKYDKADDFKKGLEKLQNHNIVGPVMLGQGVCEGIAKAALYLLRRYKIPSMLILGEAEASPGDKPGAHAWNIVELDGRNYHLDISHNVCLSPGGDRVPSYVYFNLCDAEILGDHNYNKSFYSELDCTDTKMNFYRRYGRYYTSTAHIESEVRRLCSSPKLPRGFYRLEFRTSPTITENDVKMAVLNAMSFFKSFKIHYTTCSAQNVYTFTLTP